jgi:hypothetical protein
MKHGFKLVNGEDFSPPDGKTVDVAHMDAGDQDKRLKWQVNAVLPMTGV